MLQLKKFPDIPVPTREEAPGSRPYPEEPRFRLVARDEGSFRCLFGKEFWAFASHLRRRCTPQERRELQRRATIPRDPQMSQSIPEEPAFPAPPRLSQRGSTHTTVSRGTALWKSLVGKPPGKTSRESHRCHDRRDRKRDTAATIREESVRACTVSKQGLTPLGRLLKYTKIHVSTEEEYSGSGPDFTQGLRPRNRRKKNPERPPRNSNVDWPVLRPPERVP